MIKLYGICFNKNFSFEGKDVVFWIIKNSDRKEIKQKSEYFETVDMFYLVKRELGIIKVKE